MSNVDKQAVKEITKAHKTKIKDLHNVILKDIRGFQLNLPEDSYIDPKVVNMFIASVVDYIGCYRKLANNELDSLATSFLEEQEDPTQELTKDTYDLLTSSPS